MKLYELDAAGIDRELEKTSQGIGQTTAARQGSPVADGGLTNDPGMGSGMGTAPGEPAPGGGDPLGAPGPGLEPPQNAPEDALGGVPDDLGDEQEEVKKINDALLTAVQGMPYVDEYEHDDNSKIAPEKILQMNFDELSHLRTLVTNKINMISLHDKVGMYDDPGVKWYQDLRDFVDKVFSMKKRADRPARNKAHGKTAKFEKKSSPKTKPGKYTKKNKNL